MTKSTQLAEFLQAIFHTRASAQKKVLSRPIRRVAGLRSPSS